MKIENKTLQRRKPLQGRAPLFLYQYKLMHFQVSIYILPEPFVKSLSGEIYLRRKLICLTVIAAEAEIDNLNAVDLNRLN